MERVISLVIVGLFILGWLNYSHAGTIYYAGIHLAQAMDAQTTATDAHKAIEVGNKICPVSGEKINEKLKATYEYKGKIYNFCCAACIEEFKKDPEKYIKKIEEEKQKEENKD